MITPQFFKNNANQYPNEPAISVKDNNGKWNSSTWLEFYNYTIQISKSLLASGLQPNDKISIYSYNRKERYGCYQASRHAKPCRSMGDYVSDAFIGRRS